MSTHYVVQPVERAQLEDKALPPELVSPSLDSENQGASPTHASLSTKPEVQIVSDLQRFLECARGSATTAVRIFGEDRNVATTTEQMLHALLDDGEESPDRRATLETTSTMLATLLKGYEEWLTQRNLAEEFSSLSVIREAMCAIKDALAKAPESGAAILTGEKGQALATRVAEAINANIVSITQYTGSPYDTGNDSGRQKELQDAFNDLMKHLRAAAISAGSSPRAIENMPPQETVAGGTVALPGAVSFHTKLPFVSRFGSDEARRNLIERFDGFKRELEASVERPFLVDHLRPQRNEAVQALINLCEVPIQSEVCIFTDRLKEVLHTCLKLRRDGFDAKSLDPIIIEGARYLAAGFSGTEIALETPQRGFFDRLFGISERGARKLLRGVMADEVGVASSIDLVAKEFDVRIVSERDVHAAHVSSMVTDARAVYAAEGAGLARAYIEKCLHSSVAQRAKELGVPLSFDAVERAIQRDTNEQTSSVRKYAAQVPKYPGIIIEPPPIPSTHQKNTTPNDTNGAAEYARPYVEPTCTTGRTRHRNGLAIKGYELHNASRGPYPGYVPAYNLVRLRRIARELSRELNITVTIGDQGNPFGIPTLARVGPPSDFFPSILTCRCSIGMFPRAQPKTKGQSAKERHGNPYKSRDPLLDALNPNTWDHHKKARVHSLFQALERVLTESTAQINHAEEERARAAAAQYLHEQSLKKDIHTRLPLRRECDVHAATGLAPESTTEQIKEAFKRLEGDILNAFKDKSVAPHIRLLLWTESDYPGDQGWGWESPTQDRLNFCFAAKGKVRLEIKPGDALEALSALSPQQLAELNQTITSILNSAPSTAVPL